MFATNRRYCMDSCALVIQRVRHKTRHTAGDKSNHRPAPDRSRGAYAGDDRLSDIMQKILGILGILSGALQEDELWYFFPAGEIQIIFGKGPEHHSDPAPGVPSKDLFASSSPRWSSSMRRMASACSCCISRSFRRCSSFCEAFFLSLSHLQ